MHIDLDSLFSGIIGVVLGAFLTYKLQHRLIDKQIAAAKASQDAFLAAINEFRRIFNVRLGRLISAIDNATYTAEQREQAATPQKSKGGVDSS